MKTGAPFQPVVVTGTERLPFNGEKGRAQENAPRPNPGHRGVRILFGEPLVIPREIDGRRVSTAEATEIIMIEIARLLPPDYRGIYAEALEREVKRRAIPWRPETGAGPEA
jgi:1-acyl-sn-glycerol-3-phosphate acyltransferase